MTSHGKSIPCRGNKWQVPRPWGRKELSEERETVVRGMGKWEGRNQRGWGHMKQLSWATEGVWIYRQGSRKPRKSLNRGVMDPTPISQGHSGFCEENKWKEQDGKGRDQW